MSTKEIFICLAVMFFLGHLVGSQIERHRAKIVMEELHKELVDIIEKHKKNREQMFKELDNFIIMEHENKPKEDSDD